MAETEEYVTRARAAILAILESEHALVHRELEARISEAGYTGNPENIDPHHVTTALRELREVGKIEWAEGATRGGRNVTTIQPTDTRLRSTRITAAAGPQAPTDGAIQRLGPGHQALPARTDRPGR